MIGPTQDPQHEPYRSKRIREIIVELVEKHGALNRNALHYSFQKEVYWSHVAYGIDPDEIEINFQLEVLLGNVLPEMHKSWVAGWKEWDGRRSEIP